MNRNNNYKKNQTLKLNQVNTIIKSFYEEMNWDNIIINSIDKLKAELIKDNKARVLLNRKIDYN